MVRPQPPVPLMPWIELRQRSKGTCCRIAFHRHISHNFSRCVRLPSITMELEYYGMAWVFCRRTSSISTVCAIRGFGNGDDGIQHSSQTDLFVQKSSPMQFECTLHNYNGRTTTKRSERMIKKTRTKNLFKKKNSARLLYAASERWGIFLRFCFPIFLFYFQYYSCRMLPRYVLAEYL